jgi:hypothetical protein
MSENPPPTAEQPVDPWLVERLLADRATPGDADEQALATLFAALRSPALRSELAERDKYLAAFATAQTLRTADPHSRRKSMLSTLLATKSLAAGFALVTAAGTAAAAYSGALPTTLQNVAQSVGAPAADVTHPPNSASPRPTSSAAAATTKGSGPDPTGSAARGLCNAYGKSGLGLKSTARRALSEAAGGPSNIPAFCAAVLQGAAGRPHSTGKPTGHAVGKPTAKPTGKPTTNPTVEPTTPPTAQPTVKPTVKPTGKPGGKPAGKQTGKPTEQPAKP